MKVAQSEVSMAEYGRKAVLLETTGNREGALLLVEQKKIEEKEHNKYAALYRNKMQQISAVQQALAQAEESVTYVDTSRVLRNIMKDYNVDTIAEAVDDLREQVQEVRQNDNELSRPLLKQQKQPRVEQERIEPLPSVPIRTTATAILL